MEEQEQRAYHRRQVRFSDTADGSTRVSGRLDAESAAMVRAALDPLAAPNPGPDGERDPRTAGQRTAGRAGRVGPPRLHHRRAARRSRGPPHLAVIVSLDSLSIRTGDRAGDGHDNADRFGPVASAPVAAGHLKRRVSWAGVGRSRPRRSAGSAATPA